LLHWPTSPHWPHSQPIRPAKWSAARSAGIYRKHGYVVLARISGYPNDIVKNLMHKTEA
jgi:hypothetical protein